jgi:hypothetical protein
MRRNGDQVDISGLLRLNDLACATPFGRNVLRAINKPVKFCFAPTIHHYCRSLVVILSIEYFRSPACARNGGKCEPFNYFRGGNQITVAISSEIRELISVPAIEKIKAATLLPGETRRLRRDGNCQRKMGNHPLREEYYEEKCCADLGTCYDTVARFARPPPGVKI